MRPELYQYLTAEERVMLAAAGKATPGPWSLRGSIPANGKFTVTSELNEWDLVCSYAEHSDASYITAANPIAVIRLLMSLAEARARAEIYIPCSDCGKLRHVECECPPDIWF